MIHINGASVKSGCNRVLDEINLRIEEGEFVCDLGQTGCGKSTLLLLILGSEKPSDGESLSTGVSTISRIAFEDTFLRSTRCSPTRQYSKTSRSISKCANSVCSRNCLRDSIFGAANFAARRWTTYNESA